MIGHGSREDQSEAQLDDKNSSLLFDTAESRVNCCVALLRTKALSNTHIQCSPELKHGEFSMFSRKPEQVKLHAEI